MRFFDSRIAIAICAVITFIASLSGCSGSSGNNIQMMSPSIPALSIESPENLHRSILGLYLVSVDVPTQSVEITPIRSSSLDMHVNLNPYLLGVPCRNCLRLNAVGVDISKNLLLDFTLTHAFQDRSKRPDLDGFDLRGIIILPGSKLFTLTPKTKKIIDPKTHLVIREEQKITCNPGAVINADGYTALWDYYADTIQGTPLVLPGTVNPYKNFFWEDNPDPQVIGSPIPWRTFSVGGGWDVQRYIFDTSKLGGNFQFYFLADVTYGQSATFKTRQTPFYRNPQFNIKEAYDVAVEQNSLLVSGDVTSYCDLTIRVKDWQAGAPLVDDPLNPGKDEIDAASDVRRVTVEAPDLQPGLISLDTPDSGAGTNSSPYIFTARITNTNNMTTGFYPVLIAVEDELNVTDSLDLRTFQVVMAEVRSSQIIIEFNPPERITNNPHASFVWPKECIAVGSNKMPHVVWTDDRSGDYQVYYSFRNTAGVWSTPENISQSPGQAFYATIAIDSQNRGHIVWEDTDNLDQGMNIHYGLKTGTGLAHNINLTQLSELEYAYFPKVAVDSGDEPNITFEDNKLNGNDDFDVRYIHISLAGSTPDVDADDLVGRTNAWEGHPAIAVNPQDEPRIALIREETGTSLYYSKRSGGVFDEPELISGSLANWPDMDISDTGVVTVAYSGGIQPTSQVFATYTVNDGNSWFAPVTVSSASTLDQVMPDVVLDSFGTAHIVWHEIDPVSQVPGRVKYRQYSAGGGLSGQQDITPAGFPSAFPSVVIDLENELHVAMQTFIDDNWEIFYLTSRD